jgi:hypothetical protein
MIYRYFYNATGEIQGVAPYRSQCRVISCCDSVGYIDSDLKVLPHEYRVDTDTKTLVVKETE